MQFIVNRVVSSYSLKCKPFELDNNEKNKMLKCIQYEIDEWKGVATNQCKIQKKTFKEYQTTARNWFNRNKAKYYGNYLFYPLIFFHILKVIICFNSLFVILCGVTIRFSVVIYI